MLFMHGDVTQHSISIQSSFIQEKDFSKEQSQIDGIDKIGGVCNAKIGHHCKRCQKLSFEVRRKRQLETNIKTKIENGHITRT